MKINKKKHPSMQQQHHNGHVSGQNFDLKKIGSKDKIDLKFKYGNIFFSFLFLCKIENVV